MRPNGSESSLEPNAGGLRRWRRSVIALGLVLALVIAGMIGGPSAFMRSVPIEFDWTQSGGFESISAKSPFGSPYSRLITAQSRPRIASDLQKAGWRSAKGRLNVRVFCWLFVLGLDHYNAWNVEIIDPEVTPLMQAVENGDTTSARRIIAEGANVNTQDQRGWTALMHASMKGRDAEAKLLLAAGADPNMKDRDGRTAFLWAAWNCQSGVAIALIDAGADVNVKDRFGSSAMSSTPCPGVVQDLLKKAKAVQESVSPRVAHNCLRLAIVGILSPQHTSKRNLQLRLRRSGAADRHQLWHRIIDDLSFDVVMPNVRHFQTIPGLKIASL